MYYCEQCIIASSVLLRAFPLSQPREAAQCAWSWFRSGKDQIEGRRREHFTNYTTTTLLFLGYFSEISLQSVLLSCYMLPHVFLNLFLFLTVNIFSFKMLFRYWIFAHNNAVGHILEKSRFDFCTFHTVAVKITKNYIFSSLEQCL